MCITENSAAAADICLLGMQGSWQPIHAAVAGSCVEDWQCNVVAVAATAAVAAESKSSSCRDNSSTSSKHDGQSSSRLGPVAGAELGIAVLPKAS